MGDGGWGCVPRCWFHLHRCGVVCKVQWGTRGVERWRLSGDSPRYPQAIFFGTMNLPSQDFLLVNCWPACLKYTSVNLLVLYPKHLRAWNPLSLHRGYTNSWIVKPLIFRLKRSDLEMKHSEIRCARAENTCGTYSNYFTIDPTFEEHARCRDLFVFCGVKSGLQWFSQCCSCFSEWGFNCFAQTLRVMMTAIFHSKSNYRTVLINALKKSPTQPDSMIDTSFTLKVYLRCK